MNYKLRGNLPHVSQDYVADVLLDRGVENIEGFLAPKKRFENDAMLLDNIMDGVTLFDKHLTAKNPIVFVVDTDADGITSSAVLWLYYKRLFPDAKFSYIIHTEKQHGLEDIIEQLENSEYKLVVCADSSSEDYDEHRRLNDAGIDIIVLDHHLAAETSQHAVVINNQLSLNYPNKSLCGVGVVFKFCEVLDKFYNVNYAEDYLDLVSLGEISDVMDQKDPETRYLICRGLTQINNKGLKTLIEAQAFSLKDTAHLNPTKIAFYITPLINALIRVGSMSEKEILFLCFIDPDREVQSTKRGAKNGDIETASEQTARVARNARARQNTVKDKAIGKIEFKIQKNELLDNKILIVELDDTDDLPRTMTGVVAAHFMTKYNRPCLLGRRNNDGELRGSLRGSTNFKEVPSAKEFLEASKLIECMGHNNACGFCFKLSNLSKLLTYINSSLPETLSNCYLVDYVLDSSEYISDIALQLGGAEDLWGNGVDEVHVIIEDIPLEPEKLFIMGADKSSAKFEYNGITYIRFKDEQFIQNIQDSGLGPTITVYGKFNLNEYAGKITPQFFIEDYEIRAGINKWNF